MKRRATPLKLAIVASGSFQKDIAAELGLDPAQFSRIVNGLHCDGETRQRIANALGRRVSELWPELHDAQPDAAVASDGNGRKAA